MTIPPARLSKAVAFADKRMKSFRSQRLSMLREFAGPWWGPKADEKREPINAMFALAQTMLPALQISPKAQVETDETSRRRFARTMELALNSILRDMQLEGIVTEICLDSLFGPAITFTGIAAGEWREMEDQKGYTHDEDEPFVETVSLDDYIADPFARRRSDYLFEGHRMRLPRDWALEQNDLFDVTELRKIPTTGQERPRQPRTEGLGRPADTEDDHAIDEIETWSVWLPRERKIVGLPGMSDEGTIEARGWLWERPWRYEEGPYDQLGLMPMPDSPLPVPLMGIIYDLHTLVNVILRKQARGAENFKQLLVYLLGDEKSADAVRNAKDLETIGVKDPKMLQMLQFNGADPEGFNVADKFREYMNWVAGNPDAIGGLGKQSDTLGQDQMLWNNASAKLGYWRIRLLRMLESIVGKVARHLWDDPLREVVVADKLSGLSSAVRRVWSPQWREGEFEDYRISVMPHGLESDSPERRYQRTMDWAQRLVVPLLPVMAQQGKAIDAAKLIAETGRLADLPFAEELVTGAVPVGPSGIPGQSTPAVPEPAMGV